MTNSVAPGRIGLRKTTAEQDLAAFDGLPPAIKRLLWDAPFNMSAEYVARQVRAEGCGAVEREYHADCAALLDGQAYRPAARQARQKRTFR